MRPGAVFPVSPVVPPALYDGSAIFCGDEWCSGFEHSWQLDMGQGPESTGNFVSTCGAGSYDLVHNLLLTHGPRCYAAT